MKKFKVFLPVILVLAFLLSSTAVSLAGLSYSSYIEDNGTTMTMGSSTGSSPASTVLYVRSAHYFKVAYVNRRIGQLTRKVRKSSSVTKEKTYTAKSGVYSVAGTHKWYSSRQWTQKSSSKSYTN